MSGSGFTNDIMHAENVDFSGGFPVAGKVVADGQLLIGATASPNIRVNTLTAGPGVTITNGAGSITVGLTGGLPAIETINGDSGSVTGNTVTIFANKATLNSGSTVSFSNSGTVSTFNVKDANHNIIMGNGSGNLTMSGTYNTSFGNECVAAYTTASENISMGTQVLRNLTTGVYNLCIGSSNGNNYTSSESYNILIGQSVLGTLAESNVLRIGSTTAPWAITKAFIAGIIGVTVANAQAVTINSSTGQLGVSTAPFGTTWSVITADQSAVAGNGYICNKGSALVLTLPATASIGDTIEVTGINTALGWKIAQNANQQIFFGNTSTTLGATGFLQSAAIRDSVKIVCVVAGASSVYNVISSVGNITVS